jgi:hypothetical protein
MDDTATRSRRRAIWLAWGAVGGVAVFNLGWLLTGAVQGGGYSVASRAAATLFATPARSAGDLRAGIAACFPRVRPATDEANAP